MLFNAKKIIVSGRKTLETGMSWTGLLFTTCQVPSDSGFETLICKSIFKIIAEISAIKTKMTSFSLNIGDTNRFKEFIFKQTHCVN